MNGRTILNETIDAHGRAYRLWGLVGSEVDLVNIELSSTFSGAREPLEHRAVWRAALPKESIARLHELCGEALHQHQSKASAVKVMSENITESANPTSDIDTFVSDPISQEFMRQITWESSIDIDYKPEAYFKPQRISKHLMSRVKNSVLKTSLRVQIDQGSYNPDGTLLSLAATDPDLARSLEGIHPMYMGGNYLPDFDDAEIEIARIPIQSTTYDVTSVFARMEDGQIHYRVVDEYDGDTLSGSTTMVSSIPLTLGELTEFFLKAWPLIDVLEMNFEGDLEASLSFFAAESDFYTDFDALCRKLVIERFAANDEQHEEDDDHV